MPTPGLPPRRVAVVDDDVRIRTLLRLELEDLGAMVTCFRSAEDLLRDLDGEATDLVLLDVGLPEMDGISCLKRLRQQGFKARVVLMSGHWDPVDASKRDRDGYVAVLKQRVPSLASNGPSDVRTVARELAAKFGVPMDSDRKSTRLNSSHSSVSRMPSSA